MNKLIAALLLAPLLALAQQKHSAEDTKKDIGRHRQMAAAVGSVLAAQQSLPLSGAVWLPQEAWIPAVALLTAGAAALIPAISAYRVDVAQLLQRR